MFEDCVKISTRDMSHEDWLKERRCSLGGSDMGAVLGMSKYATPLTVWMDKTGRREEKEDTEAMRVGRDLEEYVAKRFEEASGLKVQRVNAILRNGKFCSHIHANIDRRIVGQAAGLECKTANAMNEDAFLGGHFPQSYYAQCLAYMGVTGADRWYLAALVMGRGLHIYQITRVEEDVKPDWCDSSVYVGRQELTDLAEAADDFWTRYVVPDREPTAGPTDADNQALRDLHPTTGAGRIMDDRMRYLLGRLEKADEAADKADQEVESLRNQVRQLLAGAELCEDAGWKVTNKTRITDRTDWKAVQRDHPEIDTRPYTKHSAIQTLLCKRKMLKGVF